MDRESLEEELLLPSSTLVEPKHRFSDNNGIPESDSSATPVVLLSCFIAVSGFFVYGCCAGYSSPAESGIREDLGLSIAAYSVFGSTLTIGGLIGAVVCGKIADLISRRGAMWLSDVFFIIGWLAVAFSKGAWPLDLGRVSSGIGIGIIAYAAPIYVAEITTKNIRGALTATNRLMLASGLSLTFFLGIAGSWRALALLVFGLFFIPESPRWLAKIGRETELYTALQRLRGKNADISQEAADIKNYTEAFKRQSEGRVMNLFQRRFACSLIVGLGLMLLQQLGGTNAILFYASSIFEDADFSGSVGTISMAIVQINAEEDHFSWFDKDAKEVNLS